MNEPLPGLDLHVPPPEPLPYGLLSRIGTALVEFTVIGEAKGAGSKSAFKHPSTGKIIVTDSSGKKGKTWRADVRDAASEAMGERPLLLGPLLVEFTFHVDRPGGHYGTGRNEAVLRPSAPPHPHKRPDVLKLARAVEDALTHVVYKDDAQIVTERLTKRYAERGTPARCDVLVVELAV